MTAIAEAIEAFRSSFDPATGAVKGAAEGKIACQRCNVQLSGPDGPRPAETHAGSFNGLCYSCTSGERHIVAEYHDGAVRWSYPPHCPSWRRTREEYVAYPDCTDCSGDGCTRVSRPMSRGGWYRSFCSTCHARFWSVRHAIEASALRSLASRVQQAEIPSKVYGPAYAVMLVREALVAELDEGAHAGREGEQRGVRSSTLTGELGRVLEEALATKSGRPRWRSGERCRRAAVEAIEAAAAEREDKVIR